MTHARTENIYKKNTHQPQKKYQKECKMMAVSLLLLLLLIYQTIICEKNLNLD